jgi:uncharacterized RDD family membrane protein YckC
VIRPRRQTADDAATQPLDLPLFPDALERDHPAAAAGTTPVARPARAVVPAERARVGAPPVPVAPVGVAQVELPIEPVSSAGPKQVPPRSEPRPAPILGRLKAALLDVGAMLGVLAVLLAGGAVLGAPSGLSALPYYLPTWLLFSFLYHVVPFIFWGRTPGMALAGLTARTTEGEAMTGAQAVRRWIALQATLVLLGLPGLVSLTGRSLTDRASGTVTRLTG